MAQGRRRAPAAREKGAKATATCPECGTRMAPALSGLRCPRFGACGRGGLEETAARLKPRVPPALPRERTSVDAA